MPGNNRSLALLRSALLFAPLSLTVACYSGLDGNPDNQGPGDDGVGGDDGGSSDRDLDGPGTCVDTQKFFREFAQPVFRANCFACHNTSGKASTTDLVLRDVDYPGYVEANYQTVSNVAQLQFDGLSLVLAKPTMYNDLAHGGNRVLDPEGEDFALLSELVDRLDSPVHCVDDADIAKFFVGIQLLDEVQTLRKATLVLANRLPTDEEIAAVDGNGMGSLDEVLNNIMHEDAFYTRIREMFNDVWHTNRNRTGEEATNALDPDRFPNMFWYENQMDDAIRDEQMFQTNTAIAEEPLNLVEDIVRNDLPFTQVLTRQKRMINGFSARAYGLDTGMFNDPNDPNEFVAHVFDDIPDAGILSTPTFLKSFPSTDTNRNRHRSRMIQQFFQGVDVMRLAARPIDILSQTTFNPTLNNQQCYVCHTNVDPYAGLFMHWSNEGWYRTTAWFGDMVPPGVEGQEMPYDKSEGGALIWGARQIVKNPKFALGMAHTVFTGLTGQKALNEPVDPDADHYLAQIKAFEAQDYTFKKAGEEFIASNYEIRTLFRELIKSHWFRAINSDSDDPERMAQLNDMGTVFLATPEFMDRKLEALTGYPWLRNDEPAFANNFLFEFGGADSVNVMERLTNVNGIMANILQRMGNEMACQLIGPDLAKGGDAMVMKYADASTVDDGAIMDQVLYLHERLLGEALTADSAEAKRTFALYQGILADTQAGIASGDYGTDLPGPCQIANDPLTGGAIPVPTDEEGRLRAWMGVLTYLFTDFHFTYM